MDIIMHMFCCLILSLFLASSTYSLTLNSLVAENCTPGRKSCRIYLAENTTYEITHRIEITNLDTVSLSGRLNSVITCPSLYTNQSLNRENHSAIHFENVTSVILERVNIKNCYVSIGNAGDPYRSILSLTNCSMSKVVGLTVENFRQNAIFFREVPSVQIIDSSFRNGIDGRAVFFEAISSLSNVQFKTYNSNFHNIHAPLNHLENFLFLHRYGGGAGILIHLNRIMTSHFRISASNFTSCSSLLSPALFVFIGHEMSGVNRILIEKSRFIRNTQNEIFQSIGGALGAIFLSSESYLTIHGCLFQANKGFQGGALSISHYGHDPHEHKLFLNITDSSFVQNIAQHGGAIFLNGQFNPSDAFNLNLTRSRFEDNSALQSGGAIFAIQYEIYIQGGYFVNNTASLGGALATLKSVVYFIADPSGKSTIFTENFAKRQGGAIYIASSSSLRSPTPSGHLERTIDIVNNSAGVNGGGLYDSNIFPGFNRVGRYPKLSPIHANIKHNDVSLATKFPEMCFGNDVYRSIQNSPISNNQSCYFSSGSVNFSFSFKSSVLSHKRQIIATSEDIDSEISGFIYKDVEEQNLSDLRYIFVPSLKARLEVSAFDKLGNKVYVTLLFSLELNSSYNHLNDNYDEDEDYHRHGKYFYRQSFHSGTEVDLNFVVPKLYRRSESLETSAVHACIRIVAQSNRIIQGKRKKCFYAVFTKCLPGYNFNENGTCQLSYNPKDLKATRTPNQYINIRPGNLVIFRRNQTILERCPWFHCLCQRTSKVEACYFNPLKPNSQCREGMVGKFCSNCSDNGKIPYPPYSLFAIFNKQNICFTCHLPILMIFIYILITLLITITILVLKVDIFADYVRTITFYSSSLYMISHTVGFSENSAMREILYIPIIVMNLLISGLFPFCLPHESAVNRQLFETTAPFIFVVYILVFVLLVKYTSLSAKFGRYIRNIIYPIWAIIILTYTHVCNQAFILINYVKLDGNYVWFYDPNVPCFGCSGTGHYFQIGLSFFILYILLTFPLFLYIFSYLRNDYNIRHFVEIYDKRYKYRYRNWEIFKLFLRFIIGAIFWLPPTYAAILLSLIFLIMMSLTAALQPAENGLTNHFESFCFLVLAFLTLPSFSFDVSFFWMIDILALVPYILIALRFGYLFRLKARTWKFGFLRRILNRRNCCWK